MTSDARLLAAAILAAPRHDFSPQIIAGEVGALETALAGLPKDDTREPGSVPVGWVAGVLDDIAMALAYHDGPDAITKGLDAINKVRAELAQFRGA